MRDLGIDYSARRPPSGAVVAADGWRFVCRYLSWLGNSKNITAEEIADMHAHGVAVVLVFETTRYRAVDGFDAGKYDAAEALGQARAVGWPADRPIYFAVDFDVTDQVADPVWQYFAGVVAVLGQRVGVYGSYNVVKTLLDMGVKYGWQTTAWSHGQREPRMNLFQLAGQVTVDGVTCDVNEALTADYGQWPYTEDDDMTPEQDALLRDLHEQMCGNGNRAPGPYNGWELWDGTPNKATVVDMLRAVHSLLATQYPTLVPTDQGGDPAHRGNAVDYIRTGDYNGFELRREVAELRVHIDRIVTKLSA